MEHVQNVADGGTHRLRNATEPAAKGVQYRTYNRPHLANDLCYVLEDSHDHRTLLLEYPGQHKDTSHFLWGSINHLAPLN